MYQKNSSGSIEILASSRVSSSSDVKQSWLYHTFQKKFKEYRHSIQNNIECNKYVKELMNNLNIII